MKVIVVGGSSGIGAELVRQLLARGDEVASVSRRGAPVGTDARSYIHDVTDFEAVPALFQQITGDMGGLDAVIYAAGVMPPVAPDEFDFAKDKVMIDVNVLGAIAWLNQAAIRFQGVGEGTIVAIGSVAGERGRSAQPVYNTSKAALKTYMEALRNRLGRYGVKVVLIKPGPVATEMTAHLDQSRMISADSAARAILRKMDKNGEHFLNPVHQLAFAVIRNIPSFLFRKLKI